MILVDHIAHEHLNASNHILKQIPVSESGFKYFGVRSIPIKHEDMHSGRQVGTAAPG